MILNIYLAFLIFVVIAIVSTFMYKGLKQVWDLSEGEILWKIFVVGLGFLCANVMVLAGYMTICGLFF